jgi:eukaryotic-like serine/threonine-protein kinase
MIDSSFLESGRSFNGYELDHILGEGGMGSVWKARQLALHRPVAIKFLKPEYARDAHLRQRFVREGEAAARVRGPHVVEVFDVGTVDDELPYLVMEYLDGEDLRAMLLRGGALPVETLVDLLVPVCAAIQTAHECGVIHRDLKPENIHLSRGRDGTLVPKVVDFGISRVAAPARAGLSTGESALLGTPGYIAPEQARGTPGVDASVDQYALGVMLYEGLVGAHPYDHDDPMVLLVRAIEGNHVPPRVLRPELPEALEVTIVRAMSLTPRDRFPSVRDLGRALLPFASPRVQAIFDLAFGPSGPPSARPKSTLPYSPSAPPDREADPADRALDAASPRPPAPAVTQDAPAPPQTTHAPLPLTRRRRPAFPYLLAAASVATLTAVLVWQRTPSPRPRPTPVGVAWSAPAPPRVTSVPAVSARLTAAVDASPQAPSPAPVAAPTRPATVRRPRAAPARNPDPAVRTPGGSLVE